MRLRVVSPRGKSAVREVEKVFACAIERFTFCFNISSLYLLEQSGGLKIALGVCYFVPKQKRPAEVGPLSAAGTPVKKLGSWVNAFSFAAHNSPLLRMLLFVSVLLVEGGKLIVQVF